MGITLGGIGAAVSGGSALASLLGFGSTTPQAPPPAYMPQNLAGADSGAVSRARKNLRQYNTAAEFIAASHITLSQSLVQQPLRQPVPARGQRHCPGGSLRGLARSRSARAPA